MKKSKEKAKNLRRKTVLHILTGSIAAYRAGDLIQDLREEGARVVCVMTPSAKQFVTPLVLRALSGERVYDDFFALDTPYDVLHTSLAEEADIILVAPASADFMAKLAGGFADDLASCIILAARRPVIIVPAMNDQMYQHPMTQENIRKLKSIGCRFVEPVEGRLVCGKEAIGHISDSHSIIRAVRSCLGSSSLKRNVPKR